MLASLVESVPSPTLAKNIFMQDISVLPSQDLDNFAQNVKSQFEASLNPNILLTISGKLQKQFERKLQSSDACMLPSWNYTLPTGEEEGQYLALDVGGSTLRIALLELSGKSSGRTPIKIKKSKNYQIDKSVKSLAGKKFFDWLAGKIEQILHDEGITGMHSSTAVSAGLSWSFPTQQTSERDFSIMEMGKGFCACQGLIGQNLGKLIVEACQARNLNVQLETVINDSSATLLAQSYVDSSARISLIVGTGVNSAIHLPTSSLSRSKFGDRARQWFDSAECVIVNTELSLFGKEFLPYTRWDEALNCCHPQPDFQPLEYRVGGLYLGELVRLICVEAIRSAGLFRSCMPERFGDPYSLDTKLLAVIESDASPQNRHSLDAFQLSHPLPFAPSSVDIAFIRTVTQAVSRRAAAIVATAIHALSALRAKEAQTTVEQSISIACNGSIIERYPKFRDNVRKTLTQLAKEEPKVLGPIQLEIVEDAALTGAAVAASCI